MKINGTEYKTIWFDQEKKVVKIIDQTKLPHKFIIKELNSVKDAINAIKTMEVRGAPLIGGTAAFGLVLAIKENNSLDFIKKNSEELVASRPTAINLQWAVHRMNNKLSFVEPGDLFKTLPAIVFNLSLVFCVLFSGAVIIATSKQLLVGSLGSM